MIGRWLTALLGLAVAASASAEPVTPIRINGADTNRIGVAILGDGYTSAEGVAFSSAVDLFVKAFFEQQPYLAYEKYFNVYRVDVVSAESGADHPERGVQRNTALGAAYNCGGIQRLICVNTAAVNTVLTRSLAPNQRSIVIVLVNDQEYGGSGGAVAVASVHPESVEIALHEVGHSFGLLADEYDSQPPTCNNSVEPPQPNAARTIDRNEIKWARWIEAATPLPTTNAGAGVGAFEGAYYCPTGLFRPTFNSKMRSLGRPFEQVNTEQLIRRMYNLVSPIDGASPGATTLSPARAEIVDFFIETPAPAGHELRVTWSIDGSPLQTTSRSLTLPTALLTGGSHQVSAEVSDPTGAVRNDPAGALAARRTWTLNVQAATPEEIQDALREIFDRWRQ